MPDSLDSKEMIKYLEGIAIVIRSMNAYFLAMKNLLTMFPLPPAPAAQYALLRCPL
jgi:hypothetical protein